VLQKSLKMRAMSLQDKIAMGAYAGLTHLLHFCTTARSRRLAQNARPLLAHLVTSGRPGLASPAGDSAAAVQVVTKVVPGQGP
jgi:hypothetical protein